MDDLGRSLINHFKKVFISFLLEIEKAIIYLFIFLGINYFFLK